MPVKKKAVVKKPKKTPAIYFDIDLGTRYTGKSKIVEIPLPPIQTEKKGNIIDVMLGIVIGAIIMVIIYRTLVM